MKIPFDSHTIYVTSKNKLYELKSDFSKIEVPEIKKPSKESPILVIQKDQFEQAKEYLLSKNNPFKMDQETAKEYYKIGFLSKEELYTFIS